MKKKIILSGFLIGLLSVASFGIIKLTTKNSIKVDAKTVAIYSSEDSGFNATDNGGVTYIDNAIKGKKAIHLQSKGAKQNYFSVDKEVLNNETITVAGWFKMDSNTPAWSRLFEIKNGTGDSYISLMPYAPNYFNGLHICTSINGQIKTGANNTDNMLFEGAAANTQTNMPKATYVLPVYDSWVHYAYEFSGTSFKYYQNGKLLKTLNGNFSPSQFYDENSEFIFGATKVYSDNDFSGSFADIQVFNGSLSENAIKDIYNLSYSDFLTTCYTFEDGYKEAIRGYDASPVGNAKIVYDEERQSNVLYLDGTNPGNTNSSKTSINLPVNTIKGHNEITISMDVKIDNETGGYSRLFESGAAAVSTFSIGAKWGNATTLKTRFTKQTDSSMDQDLNASVSFNKWVNLTVSIDGTRADLYYDGKLVASNDNYQYANSMLWDTTNITNIGRTQFWGDNPLMGYIDNVKIYSKALTSKEVLLEGGYITILDDNEAITQEYNNFNLNWNGKSGFIDLPDYLNEGVAVAWTSSNEEIITKKGEVFFPSETTKVTLTATLSRGDISMSKQFELDVNPYINDNEYLYSNIELADASYIEDSYYYNLMETNLDYMMSLDKDRLLYNYRVIASLDTKGAQSYGAWISQSGNGAGQFESHYILALAKASQTMPNYEYKGETVLQRLTYMIDAWVECINAYAIKDPANAGYLGAYIVDNYDAIAEGRTTLINGTSPWVPWYFHHKTLEALLDVYHYANDDSLKAKAYDMLVRCTDWTANKVLGLSDEQRSKVLRYEYGGMGEVLFQIYAETNDKRHYQAAKFFEEEGLMQYTYDGIDLLTGLHANTTIPKFLAAAAEYEATGNEYYKQVCINAFEMIMTRTYANGSTSIGEHWRNEEQTDTGLDTAETCCSYNMLKLADYLYRWTGNAKYMQYYQNVFNNHILASMAPDSGLKTYLTNTEFGYYKIYHTREDSFWCCACTGLESFSKLQENIYYLQDNSVVVNMYYPSTLNYDGITITQENNISLTEKAKFVISNDKSFTLKLIVPSWSKSSKILYNGQEIPFEIEDGYISINKDFKANDTIEYAFDYSFTLSKLRGSENSYAIMYGPDLFVATLGDDNVNDVRGSQLDFGTGYTGTISPKIVLASKNIENCSKISRENGLLTLKVNTLNQGEITFVPFNQCFHERYGMYFKYYDSLDDIMDEYTIEGNQYDANLDDLTSEFTLYKTSGTGMYSKDGAIYTPSSAECKAIFNKALNDPYVIEIELDSATPSGLINGGVYVYAQNPNNAQDAIKAYNIHVDKAANANTYTVSIYQFNNTYNGQLKVASVAYEGTIKLHILVKDGKIIVFAGDNMNDIISFNCDEAFVANPSYVGIRSQYASNKITRFTIISSEVDVSTTSLVKQINDAKEIDSTNYTLDSYNDLKARIESAEQLLNKTTLVQKEINDAISQIKEAIKKLIPLGDKTQLEKLITTVEKINGSTYTTSSYSTLEKALNNAKNANYANLDQAAIDTLYDALLDAMSNLEVKGIEEPSDRPIEDPSEVSSDAKENISEEPVTPSKKKGCKSEATSTLLALLSLIGLTLSKKKHA